ncbi:PREDICTED: uncharacterized protein LOC106743967 [Dinoponera quadriceps]|uniref:Uncharacterized protein LOC106743967 n=1 Tax=Dinoponera quadriceps TaxID=609295 RepID=A0A6P3X683_DINQU|nr:PREDICTED: uncharacterized protein LOC106743967 [Dinoponera quadriceps]
MNHYVSTYRQDYTCPQMSRVRQLPSPQITDHEIAKSTACICTDSQKALEKLLHVYGESSGWSCTGLMERPLKFNLTIDKDKPDKPKSKPVNYLRTLCNIITFSLCGFKLPIRSCEEPSTVFYKLLKPAVKRPDPCEELNDEILARVTADRFKTTYQIDYSDPAAARMAQRDKPSRIAERDCEQMQCCLPIRVIIQPDSRPHCYSHLSRDDKTLKAKKCDSPRKDVPKCGKKKSEDDDRGRLLPWKSEYQDSIGKIGHGIIKVKLHHAKSNVVPVRITSN